MVLGFWFGYGVIIVGVELMCCWVIVEVLLL